MPIHNVRLSDADENTAPPLQILDMGIAGDLIFISIKQFDENFNDDNAKIIIGEPASKDHEAHYANRASMCFKVSEFCDAINMLVAADG